MTDLTDSPSGLPDTRNDRLPPGTTIGPWRIEDLVGAGGMGDVYAVVHERIGKRAALKVLHRAHARGIDVERVALEGWVVNRVGHPSIVDIFDHGIFDGRPYLVMERLRGETLAAYIARARPDPQATVEMLVQLCDALSAAHDAGIVHRDLKPDNIFLCDDSERSSPHIKLLDWSIAKVVGDSVRRTTEGRIIGTPDYLSPEQACGSDITPMTDIYSLGVIAYRMFVGRLPYDADDAVDMVTQHAVAPPIQPREVWPQIPERLERLVLAMLAKDPRDRPNCNVVIWSLRLVAEDLRAAEPRLDEATSEETSDRPTRVASITLALLAATTCTMFVGSKTVPIETFGPARANAAAAPLPRPSEPSASTTTLALVAIAPPITPIVGLRPPAAPHVELPRSPPIPLK